MSIMGAAFIAPFHTSLRAVPRARHARRRLRTAACAKRCRVSCVSDGGRPEEVLYDDMVSDEEYVVVDGKDVGELIEQLQKTGLDNFGDGSGEGIGEGFLSLAEKFSNVKDGVVGKESGEGGILSMEGPATAEDKEEVEMEYFNEAHIQLMPKWAREAYAKGDHGKLQDGAQRFGQEGSAKRLHDIVQLRKIDSNGVRVREEEGSGIFDCTVQDVSFDYSVPVEFVIDIMIEYGIQPPVEPDDGIRAGMTSDEIDRMLQLITSFDAQDLSDRYSDKGVQELADDYDLDLALVLQTCESEGIYLSRGEHTRLLITTEDRLLDILLKNGPRGRPYPHVFDGL